MTKKVIKRAFLCSAAEADSYVRIEETGYGKGYIEFKLADCTRTVNLTFDKDKKGLKKITVLKQFVDKVQELIKESLDDNNRV